MYLYSCHITNTLILQYLVQRIFNFISTKPSTLLKILLFPYWLNSNIVVILRCYVGIVILCTNKCTFHMYLIQITYSNNIFKKIMNGSAV